MEKDLSKREGNPVQQAESVEKHSLMTTPEDILSKIKSINETISRQGEDLFFKELPQEVLRLTNCINEEKLFRMTPKELEKELYPNVDGLVDRIKESTEETNAFIRETRKDWEHWAKSLKKLMKKSRKRSHTEDEAIDPKKLHATLKEADYYPAKFRIPLNDKVNSLITFVNEEMNRVWHLVNTIKLWIIMMKPKIEDGNNVGVSVQEEYITMLDGFERALSNVMSDSISYYKDRGTYLKNIILYPDVHDFKQALITYDEFHIQQCRIYLYETRNSLALMFDMIGKNINWLYVPRMESDVQHIFL